jgi:hypothetical protein
MRALAFSKLNESMAVKRVDVGTACHGEIERKCERKACGGRVNEQQYKLLMDLWDTDGERVIVFGLTRGKDMASV